MTRREADAIPDLTGDSGRDLRYTIPPTLSSQLAIRVEPGARCSLGPEGADAHRVKVVADPLGIARFHLTPSAPASEIMKLVLDIEDASRAHRHAVALRIDPEPSREMPAPPRPDTESWPGERARALLSERELQSLNDEELVQRRYPIRPNPDEAPGAFQAWRRAVALPTIEVDPVLVPRPDASHGPAQAGPETFYNWSGFELTRSSPIMRPLRGGSAGPYDWITGRWHVPDLTGRSLGDQRSSFWVGLSDGNGNTDLWQAGTEQDIVGVGWSDSPYDSPSLMMWLAGPPTAWTEFLPQQQSEQVISGLTVSTGDEIYTQAWIGDAGSGPTLSGQFGVVYIQNNTTGYSTWVYTDRGATRLKGAEAEWIMERPTIEPPVFVAPYGYYTLADYGAAVMRNAYARRANEPRGQGYVSYEGGPNNQITMIDLSGSVLSTVRPIDSEAMLFRFGSPFMVSLHDALTAATVRVSP